MDDSLMEDVAPAAPSAHHTGQAINGDTHMPQAPEPGPAAPAAAAAAAAAASPSPVAPTRPPPGPPLPEFIRIEVPGTVQDPQAVIKAMGGEDEISAAVRDDDPDRPLSIRLGENDRFATPVPSRHCDTSDLLVRVRRRKYADGRQEIVNFQPVGYVTRAYRFRALADFYFTPPETARSRPVLDLDDIRIPEDEMAFFRPPYFSKLYDSFDFQLPEEPPPAAAKAKAKAKAAAAKAEGEAAPAAAAAAAAAGDEGEGAMEMVKEEPEEMNPEAKKKPSGRGARRTFARKWAEATPAIEQEEGEASPPAAAATAAAATPAGGEGREVADTSTAVVPAPSAAKDKKAQVQLVFLAKFSDQGIPARPSDIDFKPGAAVSEIVARLFEEKPIWLRPQVDYFARARLREKEPLTGVSDWSLRRVIAYHSYSWQDGPWRLALCRWGYDPRQDPEGRFFQVIDFRDPYFRSTAYNPQQEKTKGKPSAAAAAAAAVAGGQEGQEGQQEGAEEKEPTFEQLMRFQVPPKMMNQMYILGDIDDAPLQKVLKEAQLLQQPKIDTGWFDKKTLTQIRNHLKLKSQRMRDRLLSEVPRGVAMERQQTISTKRILQRKAASSKRRTSSAGSRSRSAKGRGKKDEQHHQQQQEAGQPEQEASQQQEGQGGEGAGDGDGPEMDNTLDMR
ncbi:unnamed protein product [Vitrella brassicaformis CCMP3155]|uniref:Transcription factor IIIC subunit 5 HTH domain-containing protein n=5 Tax=Vitrella brassicaformis TaxID=1169539 RepID=A0A0G4FMI6_VITBC|nr:unnamed protein product [Vitrella brassicaformis CCMP3155]|mmetsp:Transcript_41935/g.118924  ORF Transcript_41935/g.118924 Transcript_41935/m.118924 type:complete len:673 (+) Transcript_41935:48-2066(+)|eukprot:CEM15051.1 unnamed protein product [Vitrella brassicaformis CCMP3155]